MAPVRRVHPAVASRGPVAPDASETAALRDAAAALRTARRGRVTLRIGAKEVPLPDSLLAALRVSAAELAHGNRVFVIPIHEELTTQQAADLLNVSRPHLVKLLNEDVIPSKRVGSHRRVLLQDALDYKQVRDAERRRGLNRISRISEDLGIPF